MRARLLLVFPLATTLAIVLLGQTQPCIAYRRNGELRAECNGRDIPLLRRRGLASFAIGVDGATVLGGQTWAYSVRDGRWSRLSVAAKTWTHAIYRSCGAALAPQVRLWGVTVDVVIGKPLRFTHLAQPQCSADRSLILGVDRAGRLTTNRGKVLAARGEFGSFAVSPSGEWIAFFRQGDAITTQLCIYDSDGSRTQCYSKDANGREGELDEGATAGLSVDDAGRVLLDEGYGGTCWYADGATVARRRKFPGAEPNECGGVGIASPTAAPHVIIPLGFHPAWVDKSLLQAQFGVFK